MRSHPRRRTFSPLEIGGCVLWLRPEELGGYKHGEDVTRWHDASGNANHATGSSTLPTADLSRPGRGFGRSLTYNGTDDRLTLPTITTAPPMSLFAAVRLSGTPKTDYRQLLQLHVVAWVSTMAGDVSKWGLVSSAEASSGVILNRTTPYILSGVLTAMTNIEMLTDGANRVSGLSAGTAGASGVTGLGANVASGIQFFPGDIYEMLVYDRALSLTERKPIEEYLHRRHAEPVVGLLGAA